MTEQTHFNELEQGLNNLARRPAIHSDSDLVRFAAGLDHVSRGQLSTHKRQDIWSTIMSSSSSSSTTSMARSLSPRRVPRSAGILPPVAPAPAVLFFGVMIALSVALTGIGNDSGDMVTPTVYAESAATAIASPARPQPTSTMMIEQDRQAWPNPRTYTGVITWTGNAGTGTSADTAYERDHEIAFAAKPAILGSSDPAFRGNPARLNPEELLVASVSACHMLWYLALSATAKIIVTGYVDRAEGTMEEDRAGGGHFVGAVLRPEITLAAGSDESAANAIHHEAHQKCFIAQSVNFPITVEATYRFE